MCNRFTHQVCIISCEVTLWLKPLDVVNIETIIKVFRIFALIPPISIYLLIIGRKSDRKWFQCSCTALHSLIWSWRHCLNPIVWHRLCHKRTVPPKEEISVPKIKKNSFSSSSGANAWNQIVINFRIFRPSDIFNFVFSVCQCLPIFISFSEIPMKALRISVIMVEFKFEEGV